MKGKGLQKGFNSGKDAIKLSIRAGINRKCYARNKELLKVYNNSL